MYLTNYDAKRLHRIHNNGCFIRKKGNKTLKKMM